MVSSNWKQLGSPLRPVAEDVDFFARALREWCAAHPGAQLARQSLPEPCERIELGLFQLELLERHGGGRVNVVPGVETGIQRFHGIPASLCSCRLSRHCGWRRQ